MVQGRSYGQTNGNFGTKLFAPMMAQVVQGWSGDWSFLLGLG